MIEKKISAGGVIFRINEKGAEVAIVEMIANSAWCLPKGIIDRNEDEQTAALREVREETGLKGEVLDKIGVISYWYFLKQEMIRVHKTVHFFLLDYIEGSTDDHDDEVDEARWVPIDEAISKLSYKSEKQMMQKARTMIGKLQNPIS